MAKALLVVDLQKDFLPGGALGVPHGNEVIPVVNLLLDEPWDVVVATKDWHSDDHVSFSETHEKNIGEIIEVEGIEQILWPKHCVENTPGSEFAEGWQSDKVDKVFFKGTDKNIDSYSAFFDNGHVKSTGLDDYLKSKGIDTLYVGGLATDYCVLYTVMDALNLGYRVYVIEKACRSVNLNPGDGEEALQIMKRHGAHII